MGAEAEGEKASDLLLKCIESGRVDVLCSILSQMSEFFVLSISFYVFDHC